MKFQEEEEEKERIVTFTLNEPFSLFNEVITNDQIQQKNLFQKQINILAKAFRLESVLITMSKIVKKISDLLFFSPSFLNILLFSNEVIETISYEEHFCTLKQ